MKLLSTKQAKLDKSTEFGHLSAGLSLQPAYICNGLSTCTHHKKAGCERPCLQQCGRNHFDTSYNARINRTELFANHPDAFFHLLVKEIRAHENRAYKANYKPTMRLNVLSDIPWENYRYKNKTMFEHFPNIQFIDYTKNPNRFKYELPENYHLTLSWYPKLTDAEIERTFDLGYNVAVVFDGKVPNRFKGRRVISGDKHDLRHLDERNCYVGLKFKQPLGHKGYKVRSEKPAFVILN